MPEPIIRTKQLAYVRVEATDRAKARGWHQFHFIQVGSAAECVCADYFCT